ncbi:MAG: glycosyltransferase family 4 protein [Anaerolineae bacterium]|nr:glycosyltransferase family 4 protein [Anaerolineae bacterium]
MNRKLHILMMTCHRRFKCDARGYPMAKHLVERGHDVTLVVTADCRRLGIVEADWDGVWTVETPDLLWGRLRSGLDPWNTLNRVLYLRTDERPYDLMHCFETRPTNIYPALLYKRRHHLPMIADWMDWHGRGGIIDELRPSWYRALFGHIETYYEEAFRARADGLTVISTALADRAMKLGVQPTRMCYLPNGSWPDRSTVPDSAACRRRVGLDVAGPVIGFSSLDSHLDLDLIMEVLAQIVRQYPDAQLLITGHAPQKISELAHTYDMQRNLILTGFLPYEQLPWYLGCADLFVMPFPDKVYNIGRWPSKVNDYMSVGRPTVSNPFGDVRGLFEKHKIGLLANWDSEDFAQKIIFLLEHPDIAGELGRNARRAAATEYNWKLLIRNLEEFYYRILDMSSGNPTILQDSSPTSA